MKIMLNKLELQNFMGIRHFILELNGQSVIIRGANGTGKTTLFSAFLYLLFGKNAEGKVDFSLKTLKDGQEIPNLDHAVEGIFAIDGQEITLKKVLKEKYTKKRGSSRADFTGHTTDYFIDGVPVQKKEWDQQIADLIDEETFELLTSPTYFNKSLKWEKRRSILLDVCGDISDEDVIASDKALSALLDILNNKSLEDQKKIIAARRKEINQRLTEIPARIDELDKSLADVSDIDRGAIEREISELDGEIQAMKDDTNLAHLRKQKAELQAQLSELEAEKERARREASKEIDDKIDSLEGAVRSSRALARTLLEEIVRKESLIKQNEQSMERLRNKYSEVAGQKADVKDACPTCGQALPKDQVQEAIKKHNEQQANYLADINAAGKRLKSENTRLQEEIEAATKKGIANDGEIEKLESQIKELTEKSLNVPFDTGKISKAKVALEAVEKQISENQPPDTTALEKERNMLRVQIVEVEAAQKTRARIEDLKAEEKKLAADYEELERQLSLMEQFTVAKVEMLEDKINSRFELARFKLFDRQINEGIKETCITLYDGVPYGYGLNTGAEINVGLDIVRTLSAHYGIKAPIFIDHAESVTDILDPGTQTIKLMVSDDHQEMEVTNE